MNDRSRSRRRVGAAVAHNEYVAIVRRITMIMLPLWIAFFFAINQFAKNLSAVTVPYVGLSLGTYLVILGAAVVFAMTLYLAARSSRSAIRP